MKSFSKEEIEGAREWMVSQKYPLTQVSLGNYNFDYFTMPQFLETNLPDFVYRCTGKKEDGYVIGISDSVQENFRKYSTLHEFVEFMHIGLENKGRCCSAMQIELSFVPNKIKRPYVNMRERFFTNLVEYASKIPEKFTIEDIEEFKGSLNVLRQSKNFIPIYR